MGRGMHSGFGVISAVCVAAWLPCLLRNLSAWVSMCQGTGRDVWEPTIEVCVQVIEFESTALMIGHLGVRVSLIAYPIVSIKKVRNKNGRCRGVWPGLDAPGRRSSIGVQGAAVASNCVAGAACMVKCLCLLRLSPGCDFSTMWCFLVDVFKCEGVYLICC